MPRVHHVKKARKDNPVAEKGEEYYWWKFRFGPKRYSKTYPKASQLTQSDFLSELYSLKEDIDSGSYSDFDSMESNRDDIANSLQELCDQCEDSLDNMPEHLQDTSDSGCTLQERIDYLKCSVFEIESYEIPEEPQNDEAWAEEVEDWDEYSDKEKEDFKDEWKDGKVNEFIEFIDENWPEL